MRGAELDVARERANVGRLEARVAKAKERLSYREDRAAKQRAGKAWRAERTLKMARLLRDGWTAKDVGREFGLHPIYVSRLVKLAARGVVRRPIDVGQVRRAAVLLLARSAP